MDNGLAVTDKRKETEIRYPLLTENKVEAKILPWIFLFESTKNPKSFNPEYRTHYIELWEREIGVPINESTWLLGLEIIREEEFYFNSQNHLPVDIGKMIRGLINKLPYEDRLEIVAIEVFILGKRYFPFLKRKYHCVVSLYRHLD